MHNFKKFKYENGKLNVTIVYDLNKLSIRVTCATLLDASKCIASLVYDKKIPIIDAVIFNAPDDKTLVHLFRGKHLTNFLRLSANIKPKIETKKKTFTNLAAENE